MMPKPVCVKCQRFYRPERNGTDWIEMMPIKNGVEPGTAEPDKWKPYKLWSSDLWECRVCGHQILSGHGHQRFAENFQTDFAVKMTRLGPNPIKVNDC